jgi:hypothetical protein
MKRKLSQSLTLFVQVRGRVATEEGGAAAWRRDRAGQPALRFHRHRQLRPGHAAARPQWQGKLRQLDSLDQDLQQLDLNGKVSYGSLTAWTRTCSSSTQGQGKLLQLD